MHYLCILNCKISLLELTNNAYCLCQIIYCHLFKYEEALMVAEESRIGSLIDVDLQEVKALANIIATVFVFLILSL